MNLKEFVLGVAVLVLTLFVTTYGVNMFFSQPQYDDFCSPTLWKVGVLNETTCFDLGGKWTAEERQCITAPCPQGYCDQDYSCREAYNLNLERYHMNVFLISIPLGIALILFGFYFFGFDAIAVGIMAGGVGTVLRGVGSYWAYTEDWIRFLISLAGLFILIYFSYKFKERISGRKKR